MPPVTRTVPQGRSVPGESSARTRRGRAPGRPASGPRLPGVEEGGEGGPVGYGCVGSGPADEEDPAGVLGLRGPHQPVHRGVGETAAGEDHEHRPGVPLVGRPGTQGPKGAAEHGPYGAGQLLALGARGGDRQDHHVGHGGAERVQAGVHRDAEAEAVVAEDRPGTAVGAAGGLGQRFVGDGVEVALPPGEPVGGDGPGDVRGDGGQRPALAVGEVDAGAVGAGGDADAGGEAAPAVQGDAGPGEGQGDAVGRFAVPE